MKNIYEELFKLSSKENQKKIDEFIHDTENMEFPVLSEKHPYLKNSGSERIHTIEDIFFEIVFLKDHTEFKIISDFDSNYKIKTEIIHAIKKNTYEIEFTIFNKENENDSLFASFVFKDNHLLESEFDDSLSIELKSKKAQKDPYSHELYVFADENIMSIIFDNYLNANELSDILLLNDIDISNDDILKSIVKQANIINEHKNNNSNLKKLKI